MNLCLLIRRIYIQAVVESSDSGKVCGAVLTGPRGCPETVGWMWRSTQRGAGGMKSTTPDAPPVLATLCWCTPAHHFTSIFMSFATRLFFFRIFYIFWVHHIDGYHHMSALHFCLLIFMTEEKVPNKNFFLASTSERSVWNPYLLKMQFFPLAFAIYFVWIRLSVPIFTHYHIQIVLLEGRRQGRVLYKCCKRLCMELCVFKVSYIFIFCPYSDLQLCAYIKF